MLATQPHAPLVAEAAQLHVFQPRPTTPRRHMHVLAGEVALQRQRRVCNGVARARQHHHRVGQQRRMPNGRRCRQQNVRSRINGACQQLGFELAAVSAHSRHVDARRLLGNGGHERWQKRGFQRIAHRQREAALARGGVEARAFAQRALEALQCGAHLGDERARQRRRHHALPTALEQRVVKQLAQPPERVAHGGLRQVERARGRRDPTFRIDGVEDDKQVQVDPGDMHGIDGP
jgi:hypothetical protein